MGLARWLGLTLSCWALLTSSGCSIGPTVLCTNFLHFNEAVAETENEQFLLNIVKLRYRDPPKSLAVGSLTNQMELDTAGPVSLAAGLPQVLGRSQNIWTLAGTYRDVPTISLSPLTGADYIVGMVTPVPLERIVVQWPTRVGTSIRLLALLAGKPLYNMNGVENAAHIAGQGGERVPRYSEFLSVANTLGRASKHEGLLELATGTHPRGRR